MKALFTMALRVSPDAEGLSYAADEIEKVAAAIRDDILDGVIYNPNNKAKQTIGTWQMDLPTHYTVVELAERWKMSVSGIYKMIRDGRLPSIKLGHRSVRIPEDAVRRIEEEQKQREEP